MMSTLLPPCLMPDDAAMSTSPLFDDADADAPLTLMLL